jgi:dTDP-4-amino-4,6-dideoxygalactose transaminase
MIKFFGLDRQYKTLQQEILDVTDQVLKTGQVLDGYYTEKFERSMAARCHRTYAISVNSCSQALIFAQSFLKTKKDIPSKTIIPSLSFIATLNSVVLAGNTPVFCDTDDQGLIDLDSIDYPITGSGVKTIMYVNLFGNVIDYDRFKIASDFFNSDLYIIEDAAQSFGASYKGVPSGKLGTVSCLSFDPTKNLPNYGSGGMILTDDPEINEFLRGWKNNGRVNGFYHSIGTNSKMSESDCAQMLVKLKYFDSWQKRRSDIAEYYNSELENIIDIPRTQEDVVHAWHKYVIKYHDRNALARHLLANSIETKVHYDTPLFDTPLGFNYIQSTDIFYRQSTAFCMECLSLPIYPELTDAEVEKIIETIKRFIS